MALRTPVPSPGSSWVGKGLLRALGLQARPGWPEKDTQQPLRFRSGGDQRLGVQAPLAVDLWRLGLRQCDPNM